MAKADICPAHCPNRCAVPNCHNEQTCERWRAHMEEVRADREARKSRGKEFMDYRDARRFKQRELIRDSERRKSRGS